MQIEYISKAGGRKNNQDYCAYVEAESCYCFALADGLGGHRGGATAARTIVKGTLDAFKANPSMSVKSLKEYLENARLAFIAERAKDKALAGMKATLVVVVADHKEALWSHIGDSRFYLFRSDKIVIQTRDHSVPRHLVDSEEISEEQIRFHEDRNRLTRAFDGDSIERMVITEKPFLLSSNDALLLCSDGFWEYVLEEEMLSDLKVSDHPADWLNLMEARLIDSADAKHDNYSALAVFNH